MEKLRPLVVWVVFVVGLSNAIADGHRETQGPSPYQLATVTFAGAVVGLVRSDGLGWEGAQLSNDDIRRFQGSAAKLTVDGIATRDPIAAARGVIEALGVAVMSVAQRPDPMGTVELVVDGKRAQVLQLLKVPNNYQPTWQVGYVAQKAFTLTWNNVPLDRDVRLRVHLEDFDPIGGNDTIGTVEVNTDDLRRAAATRRVVPVYVGDQSSQQLMFVNVSVTSQSAP